MGIKSEYFTQLEGECAILKSGGVFKQADIYIRNRFLYAKANGGFVRLVDNGVTSHPRVFWEHISAPFEIKQFGHLAVRG